jgi:very-short-patch-repair endonuclease
MRYTEIDRRVEALAGTQHGAFTRQQAFELGASERFVQRRLAQKHWVRVVAGVFVLAVSRGTWKRQCKIAELSVDEAAIAGYSAAALHGLPDFRPGHIELVVPVNSYCTHPFATLHRYAGATLTEVNGIQVTTIPQTLFDIAPRVGLWRLERAMDDALLGKRIAVADLEERLTFYRESRRPGLPRIRPLIVERLEEGWTPPESELEALLAVVLERLSSRPRIVRQATFPWRFAASERVDFLLPDHRLIIEADGRRWHARYADFDRDRWRDNEAVAHGHRVLRFTWVHLHDLANDVLDVIDRTIHGTFAAAS